MLKRLHKIWGQGSSGVRYREHCVNVLIRIDVADGCCYVIKVVAGRIENALLGRRKL